MLKKNLLEKAAELWGWLIIVIAFIGLGIGATFSTIYFISGIAGKIIGLLLAFVIVILGIYIATKQYRGKGTMHALSRTIASPDLDNADEA